MKAKIGKQVVDKAERRERAYHIYDQEIPGFILRVQPSGSMTYYFDYRLNGKPKRRYKIGKTKVISAAQARDRAKELAADVTRGGGPTR
ncbi:Arm DNA-binding domain-containing protein [Bdellovibrionota bacterium FG-2]